MKKQFKEMAILSLDEWLPTFELHTMNGRNYISCVNPFTREYMPEFELTKSKTLSGYLKKFSSALQEYYTHNKGGNPDSILWYLSPLSDIPNEKAKVKVVTKENIVYTAYICQRIDETFYLLGGPKYDTLQGFLPSNLQNVCTNCKQGFTKGTECTNC